jgi:hypothetical protein
VKQDPNITKPHIYTPLSFQKIVSEFSLAFHQLMDTVGKIHMLFRQALDGSSGGSRGSYSSSSWSSSPSSSSSSSSSSLHFSLFSSPSSSNPDSSAVGSGATAETEAPNDFSPPLPPRVGPGVYQNEYHPPTPEVGSGVTPEPPIVEDSPIFQDKK